MINIDGPVSTHSISIDDISMSSELIPVGPVVPAAMAEDLHQPRRRKRESSKASEPWPFLQPLDLS